jgi:hypothetical protein
MEDMYVLAGVLTGLAIYDIGKYLVGNMLKRKWGENPKKWGKQ